MIKGLKVLMVIWAAVAISVGLTYIFIPRQLGEIGGFEKGPVWVMYILALLGVCFIASGGFVIAAAVRGPMKHLMWVQFVTAVALLLAVVAASSIMWGLVTFKQGGMLLIINIILGVLLLGFYPWRKAPTD
jgi:hypothetical protein